VSDGAGEGLRDTGIQQTQSICGSKKIGGRGHRRERNHGRPWKQIVITDGGKSRGKKEEVLGRRQVYGTKQNTGGALTRCTLGDLCPTFNFLRVRGISPPLLGPEKVDNGGRSNSKVYSGGAEGGGT